MNGRARSRARRANNKPPATGVPATAIVTETSDPLVTETGTTLVTE